MTVLAAKVLLAPLFVVAISLAGRRWGIAVAGVLGGLPVVAGPILLVETLLHGARLRRRRSFGRPARAGRPDRVRGRLRARCEGGRADPERALRLDGIPPPRRHPRRCRPVAGAVLGERLGVLRPGPQGAAPRAPARAPGRPTPLGPAGARPLGARPRPRADRRLRPARTPPERSARALPGSDQRLAVFTNAQGGIAQTTILLRSFLLGFYGFAAFCCALSIALPTMSTTAAFGLATAAALAVGAAISRLRARLVPAPSTS
jgi:hypothetical protein